MITKKKKKFTRYIKIQTFVYIYKFFERKVTGALISHNELGHQFCVARAVSFNRRPNKRVPRLNQKHFFLFSFCLFVFYCDRLEAKMRCDGHGRGPLSMLLGLTKTFS